MSTVRSQPPMVADELRRQADNFLELQDLAQDICRSHTPREPRESYHRDHQRNTPQAEPEYEEDLDEDLEDDEYYDDEDEEV